MKPDTSQKLIDLAFREFVADELRSCKEHLDSLGIRVASCRTRPLHQNTAKVNPLILAFNNSDYIHIVPHFHRLHCRWGV